MLLNPTWMPGELPCSQRSHYQGARRHTPDYHVPAISYDVITITITKWPHQSDRICHHARDRICPEIAHVALVPIALHNLYSMMAVSQGAGKGSQQLALKKKNQIQAMACIQHPHQRHFCLHLLACVKRDYIPAHLNAPSRPSPLQYVLGTTPIQIIITIQTKGLTKERRWRGQRHSQGAN
jgi:hypothetical protein